MIAPLMGPSMVPMPPIMTMTRWHGPVDAEAAWGWIRTGSDKTRHGHAGLKEEMRKMTSLVRYSSMPMTSAAISLSRIPSWPALFGAHDGVNQHHRSDSDHQGNIIQNR